MNPSTRGEGLRLQLSGVDVVSMRVAGALDGTIVLAAAARNAPGAGTLSATAAGLTWQAPGSATPGPAVPIVSDGGYLLEDGEDASKWIRLQVYTAYLPASGAATIELGDRYNELGPADVIASDALAGLVTTTEYTLLNVSGNTITAVVLWIDPSASGLQVSSDGTNFFTPTTPTDTHSLKWATIAAGASVNVWVKRTIGAASASNPGILNVLQWAWNGS